MGMLSIDRVCPPDRCNWIHEERVVQMRRKKAGQFSLQSLEKRLLFTSTPASPRAIDVVTLAERQALFTRLTNLNSTTKSTLQADLNASNSTKFDTDLLSY